jgi:hypothetical protein
LPSSDNSHPTILCWCSRQTRFDTNKYSVPSRAVGRPVEIQAYADRIVIRQDGALIGEHRRRFGRGETIYDCQTASNRDPGSASKKDSSPALGQACPGRQTGTSHARRSVAGEGTAQRARVPPMDFGDDPLSQ